MYTIQYFIDKFTAIPEDQLCSNTLINDDNKRCAFGHCLPPEANIDNALTFAWGNEMCTGPINVEIQALIDIGAKYFNYGYIIPAINNGNDERFQQPTEKQRVLAALQWCKEQEAQKIIASALIDPEDEEEEDYQEDDEDYRVQKMKEDHPGHSEEAYRTGDMLGVGFPYVPGDPFW